MKYKNSSPKWHPERESRELRFSLESGTPPPKEGPHTESKEDLSPEERASASAEKIAAKYEDKARAVIEHHGTDYSALISMEQAHMDEMRAGYEPEWNPVKGGGFQDVGFEASDMVQHIRRQNEELYHPMGLHMFAISGKVIIKPWTPPAPKAIPMEYAHGHGHPGMDAHPAYGSGVAPGYGPSATLSGDYFEGGLPSADAVPTPTLSEMELARIEEKIEELLKKYPTLATIPDIKEKWLNFSKRANEFPRDKKLTTEDMEKFTEWTRATLNNEDWKKLLEEEITLPELWERYKAEKPKPVVEDLPAPAPEISSAVLPKINIKVRNESEDTKNVITTVQDIVSKLPDADRALLEGTTIDIDPAPIFVGHQRQEDGMSIFLGEKSDRIEVERIVKDAITDIRAQNERAAEELPTPKTMSPEDTKAFQDWIFSTTGKHIESIKKALASGLDIAKLAEEFQKNVLPKMEEKKNESAEELPAPPKLETAPQQEKGKDTDIEALKKIEQLQKDVNAAREKYPTSRDLFSLDVKVSSLAKKTPLSQLQNIDISGLQQELKTIENRLGNTQVPDVRFKEFKDEFKGEEAKKIYEILSGPDQEKATRAAFDALGIGQHWERLKDYVFLNRTLLALGPQNGVGFGESPYEMLTLHQRALDDGSAALYTEKTKDLFHDLGTIYIEYDASKNNVEKISCYGEQKDSEATAKGMLAELDLRALEGREAKPKNADEALKEMKEAEGKTIEAKAAYEKSPNDPVALLAYYRALHNERVIGEKNDRVLRENGKDTMHKWDLREKEGTILAEADPVLKGKFLELIRNEPDRADIMRTLENGEERANYQKMDRENQAVFEKTLQDLRALMQSEYQPNSLNDAEKSINQFNPPYEWRPNQDKGQDVSQNTVKQMQEIATCLKNAVESNKAFERASKDGKEIDFARKMLFSEQRQLMRVDQDLNKLYGLPNGTKYPWIETRLNEILDMNKKLEK